MAFEKVLQTTPIDNDALSGLVALDLAEGRTADARKRAEARLALTPKDPAALDAAARVYDAIGLDSKAEEMWRTLVAVDPNQLDAYLALGRN